VEDIKSTNGLIFETTYMLRPNSGLPDCYPQQHMRLWARLTDVARL